MQSNKPPFTLEIFDGSAQIHAAPFTLEPSRGILARSPWLNVSAIENVSFTVRPASGESLTVRLFGLLKAQASNERFTVTIQGTQGFNRNNLAFTVFVSTKRGEAAA